MKTLAACLLCLAWSGASAAPITSPATLQDGVRHYDSGNFDGAVKIFSELSLSEPRSAALHYNLGNSYFKGGFTGKAIASYQRAFDILPRDSDTRYNLEFALKKAGEDLVPPGVPAPLFRLFYSLSLTELAGLHWLACWITLLLSCLFLHLEARRDVLGRWCLAAALAWGAAGLWWLARGSLEPAERGVIIEGDAEIRSGPGDNFSVNFTAPEGRRVEILSESGDWTEIGVLKESAKGWLKSKAVEKIARGE